MSLETLTSDVPASENVVFVDLAGEFGTDQCRLVEHGEGLEQGRHGPHGGE